MYTAYDNGLTLILIIFLFFFVRNVPAPTIRSCIISLDLHQKYYQISRKSDFMRSISSNISISISTPQNQLRDH